MTTAERAWLDAICRLGCIVCRILGYGFTPAVPHHLLSGGRRIGHLSSIPLCDPGHHQYATKSSEKISRHSPHGKARFEAAYGTEQDLLAITRKAVGIEVTSIPARAAHCSLLVSAW